MHFIQLLQQRPAMCRRRREWPVHPDFRSLRWPSGGVHGRSMLQRRRLPGPAGMRLPRQSAQHGHVGFPPLPAARQLSGGFRLWPRRLLLAEPRCQLRQRHGCSGLLLPHAQRRLHRRQRMPEVRDDRRRILRVRSARQTLGMLEPGVQRLKRSTGTRCERSVDPHSGPHDRGSPSRAS